MHGSSRLCSVARTVAVTHPLAITKRARREVVLIVGTVTYVTLFVTWLLLHFGENTRRVEDIAFLPLYLAAGVGVWMGAPLSGPDWRTRIGWRLIAIGWMLSFVAALGWATAPQSASVDLIADMLYTAYYPLLVAGFAMLWVLPDRERARIRLLIETLIVLVAYLTFAWYFANAGATYLSHLERIVGLGELTGFGEIWVLIAASIASHAPPAANRRPALQFLTLGALFAAVGDLALGYLDPAQQHEQRQLAVIILAIAATLFAGTGAVSRASRDRPTRLDSGAWLPYTAIIVLGALLVSEVLRPTANFRLLSGLTLGGILLIALVLLRLMLAERSVRDQRRANVAQDARYRALIQRSREALLVVDAEGLLRYASAASTAIFGWDVERVVDNRLADLLPDGERNPIIEALSAPRDGRVVLWSATTARGRRDLESEISDLRDDATVRGLVLNTRDVTERTALETRLRQSQKLDALGLLAGGVAHDFNNILTVIRGTAEIVASRGLSESAEDMHQIQLASDRGAALCRQLLAFGRAEVVRSEVLDLGSVTRGILPMLQRLLPSGISLELTSVGAPMYVSCDRAQLEIAVLNLVINSRDAMPDGGAITVATGTEVVVNDASAPAGEDVPVGRYATVTVGDCGTGMDEATRARAFDPFYTTKPVGSGTGLGLSTVYGFVTSAGGSVRLRSAPGQGTTVTLLFPLADATFTSAVTPEATGEAREGSVVLLVDDERDLRGTLARYLTSTGYQVHQACDGVEAIEALDAMAMPPDAVISDVSMPRMNGVTLARTLRERHADLPIILISGHMAAVAKLHELPSAVDFLSKPFTLAQLSQLLNRRVRERDGVQGLAGTDSTAPSAQ